MRLKPLCGVCFWLAADTVSNTFYADCWLAHQHNAAGKSGKHIQLLQPGGPYSGSPEPFPSSGSPPTYPCSGTEVANNSLGAGLQEGFNKLKQ